MSSGRPMLPRSKKKPRQARLAAAVSHAVRPNHLNHLMLAMFVMVAVLVLPACDLLPQTAGEWTVALVIAGVLVVGVGVMAWVTSRQNDQNKK